MALPIARVLRTDGGVQFDANCLAFQLIGKGTVSAQSRLGGNTNPGSVLVPIPSLSTTRVLAVSSTFLVAKAGTYQSGSQSYAHFASASASGTLNYWLFDIAQNLQPAVVGLTLRNPSTGAIVYSSDYDVMRAVDIMSGDGASFSGDGAATYAVVQFDFAGHRRAPTDGQYYANGSLISWDGTPQDASTLWSYQNDGKLYGAAVNGAAVTSGDLSWDDVNSQLGYGSTPPPFPPDWERPFSALVVDVTGL